MKRISKTRSKLFAGIGRSGIGRSVAWSFVLSLLLGAGSCTQSDVVEYGIPPQALKEVDAEFNLSVLANQTPVARSITFTPDGTTESDTLTVGAKDAAQDTAQTKAAAALSDKQEEKIAELWVGQYDATTGKLLYNQFLSSITGTKVNLKLKRSEDKTSESHVYFVTNAGDLGKIAQEADLLTHTLNYVSTAEGLPEKNLCPMMGTLKDVVIVDNMKDITVELTRLVAKITFAYTISNTANFEFTPTSVVLKNAPKVSQVEAPKAQLVANTYRDYTGTVNNTGATLYWYLPENKAGTVSGSNAVDSEMKKIGTGVTNATCIELTGNAKQGGVTYSDVTFRFFPGTNENNYDIERNTHHKMEVNLIGIDISDKRITVGTIPPVVDPDAMPAEKGSTAEVQITARPGQQWNFQMPSWLSAQLNETTAILPEATVSKDGPAKLLFKAETVNPNSDPRTFTFSVNLAGTEKPEEITISQAASEFSATNPAKQIAAAVNSTTTGSIEATEGLAWTIAPKTSNGITVDPQNGTGPKELTFTGAANTTEAARKGEFTISVTDAPKRTARITVTQSVAEAYVGDLQVCKADEGKKNWSDAEQYCDRLETEGKEDWRLPTKDELVIMYKNKGTLQAVIGFQAFESNWYWSSDEYSSGKHWLVIFTNGGTYYNPDTSPYNVRCVRGN